jgi:hypothetical protein
VVVVVVGGALEEPQAASASATSAVAQIKATRWGDRFVGTGGV